MDLMTVGKARWLTLRPRVNVLRSELESAKEGSSFSENFGNPQDLRVWKRERVETVSVTILHLLTNVQMIIVHWHRRRSSFKEAEGRFYVADEVSTSLTIKRSC